MILLSVIGGRTLCVLLRLELRRLPTGHAYSTTTSVPLPNSDRRDAAHSLR